MTRRPDAGLTLVEMLVALAILSVIGVAGLAMLDTTLNVQRGTEDRLDRMEHIDRAMTVLRRDLATAASGPVELSDEGLVFDRIASVGPLTIRVTLEDGALIRQARSAVDTAEPAPQRLLDGVRAVRWRLLEQSRVWQPEWEDPTRRPRAAELTLRLDLPGRGEAAEITRLFAMPAGATP